MIFNIYYINFPKVYEIKMMLNNIISSQQQVEKQSTVEGGVDFKGGLDLKFLEIFKIGNFESSGNLKGNGAKKVLETFEVKTTKSVILDEVVKKSKRINSFDDVKEGELIILDDVKLTLENENELRMVKVSNGGAFKNFVAPGADGLDMNSLFNSMFKDYAYKIKGETLEEKNKILIKIPLAFENEFESSYSVDDLFVGKVSIVGLYKGKIKVDDLKNSFQYFQELGQQNSQIKNDNGIEDSNPTQEANISPFSFKSSGDKSDYHYIDLL